MESKLQQILEELHEELAKKLLKVVKDGSANASEMNVARQLLKDNGIDAVPSKGSPLGDLSAEIGDVPDSITFN